MAFGLDDILWIIAGGTYMASRTAQDLWDQADYDVVSATNAKSKPTKRMSKTEMAIYESMSRRLCSAMSDTDLEAKYFIMIRSKERSTNEQIMRRLEEYKRDNPAWCFSFGGSANPWDKVGDEHWIDDTDKSIILDLLMQTHHKRSSAVLDKYIYHHFKCTKTKPNSYRHIERV